MKLSVILPVYNVEEYIERCVSSVLTQKTDEEYELIIIDDGSNDKSGSICDRLAASDSRVRVYHKANGGVSSARNEGIRAARGEYLAFIDGDDEYEADFVSEMLKAVADGTDMAMCDSTTLYGSGKTEPDTIPGLTDDMPLEHKDIAELLPVLAGSVCRCVYRKETVISHGIIFPEGIKLSEDRIINMYAMGYANRLKYIKKPLYIRRIRDGSAVGKYYPELFSMQLEVYLRQKEAIAAAWENSEQLREKYASAFVSAAFYSICNEYRKENKKNSAEKRKKLADILSNPELRSALLSCGQTNRYAKLIGKANISYLSLIAWIKNIKDRT